MPRRIVLLALFASLLPLASEAAEDHKKKSDNAETVDTDDRLGEMITIPAGSFLMGNNGHEPSSPPEELPQHSVHLPAYQIGKYEVTRGEYRRFIEDGGYENPDYWSSEGWKWKESDVVVHSGMHGKVTRTVRPNAEQETQSAGALGSGTRMDRTRIRPPPLYPDRQTSRGGRHLL